MNMKNKQQSWSAHLRVVLKNIGKRKIIVIVMHLSIKGKTGMSHFLQTSEQSQYKSKIKKNLTSPRPTSFFLQPMPPPI